MANSSHISGMVMERFPKTGNFSKNSRQNWENLEKKIIFAVGEETLPRVYLSRKYLLSLANRILNHNVIYEPF